MVSPNFQPSKPICTKFVIHKSEDYLEIYPPSPNTFTFKEKLLGGLLPLKTRLLISGLIVVLVSIMLWISYLLMGLNPLIVISFMVIPGLLLWIFTFPKRMYLYLDREADRFEIRLRSLEANHREKIQTKARISEIQQVTVLEKYQGNYCTGRTIAIQAKQTYSLDWNLTKAESCWIVDEIRIWLLLQH